jgi:hypothetical protein
VFGWPRRPTPSPPVRLASPAAALLWLPTLRTDAATRAFYERAGCRVIAASGGGADEEGEPDVAYEWTP